MFVNVSTNEIMTLTDSVRQAKCLTDKITTYTYLRGRKYYLEFKFQK